MRIRVLPKIVRHILEFDLMKTSWCRKCDLAADEIWMTCRWDTPAAGQTPPLRAP